MLGVVSIRKNELWLIHYLC